MPSLAVYAPHIEPLTLSPREAATALAISRATLDRQIAAGKIKATRLGSTVRISRDEISRLVSGKSIAEQAAELPSSQRIDAIKQALGLLSEAERAAVLAPAIFKGYSQGHTEGTVEGVGT